MKTIYLSIFLILILQVSHAQDSLFKITYTVNLTVGEIFNEDDLIENTDSTDKEVVEFFQKMEEVIKSTAKEKNKSLISYASNGKFTRQERSENRITDEEFILLEHLHRKMRLFHIFENKPIYFEYPLCPGCNNKRISYQIKTFFDDKKEILGLECYKVEITVEEENIGLFEKEIWKIDAYVTESIPLPLDIVSGLMHPIFGHCALEFSSYPIGEDINIRETYTAVKKEIVSPSYLELPTEYLKAKEDKEALKKIFLQKLKDYKN